MTRYFGPDMVRRHPDNPIISREDIPFPCNSVFNAGVAKLDDEVVLLLRIEDLRGRSVFGLARSNDGHHFRIEDEPVLTPAEDGMWACYEARGIEDPRITFLEGKYHVVYTAVSDLGYRLALARTEDFREFERVALISEPPNKDGALFPKKIDGKYARLDRPMVGDLGNIWISRSDDLVHWGCAEIAMTIRGGSWDNWRIGASVPPIEIEQGWLVIYHGVKQTSHGPLYRLGAAILDRDDPDHVLTRAGIPILSPRESYERMGDIPNVVYSCGALIEGDELILYYSGADSCLCMGTVRMNELLDLCSMDVEASHVDEGAKARKKK